MFTVSARSFLRNVLQTWARWEAGCFARFNTLFVKQLLARLTRHTPHSQSHSQSRCSAGGGGGMSCVRKTARTTGASLTELKLKLNTALEQSVHSSTNTFRGGKLDVNKSVLVLTGRLASV